MELPEEYQEVGEAFEFMDTNHSIKTLGFVWKPLLDKFSFTVSHMESDVNGAQFTKRQMLSDVAKVFDPLGWLTPVTLQLKHLLQKTSESRTDWDENLPKEISSAYLEWRFKLVCLQHLELDRFVLSANQSRDIALHIFCDASEKGYAACVYVLSTGSDDLRKSMMLVAKSKVAPMKTQSLLRLELCAVLLGVTLLNSIVQSLRPMQIVASEIHG